MTQSLKDRTVVIVGASSGIGRGIARRSIDQGALVLAAARRSQLLEALVAEAGAGRAIQCDLLEDDAGQRIADEVRRDSELLDALVVSAGSAPLRRLADTSMDEWRSALDTNLIGINRLVAGVLPVLSPESVVIVVSSETATLPRSHLGAYGASKAALGPFRAAMARGVSVAADDLSLARWDNADGIRASVRS